MAFTSSLELQIFHIYCLWCHLCLLVCGSWNRIEWVGLEETFQRPSGPTPRPGHGHHSSTHFFKGPIKLLLPPLPPLPVATADPETSACSMAQTRSNFPRRSCPLTAGQQSFASFRAFARYKWAWKGIGSEMCFRMPCWMCKHGWELPSINTGVRRKARLLLIVRRTQYILLPTYKKMFITCNCTEVCASQQQWLVISLLFSFTLIASISEDICISFHGSERTKYMYMW